MNTANLQLEGLLAAIAALNNLLVSKGIVSRGELEKALHVAEATATGDDRLSELSPANRDAIVFPLRLLRLANNMASADGVPPFSELARTVGETKQPYNDQL